MFWDFLVILLILFSGIYTPFRIAFYEDEDDFQLGLDLAVDLLFIVDIILTFLSAYYDSN